MKTVFHESGVPVGFVLHNDMTGGAFDERRVGLDHVASNVRDLHEWIEIWIDSGSHIQVSTPRSAVRS